MTVKYDPYNLKQNKISCTNLCADKAEQNNR